MGGDVTASEMLGPADVLKRMLCYARPILVKGISWEHLNGNSLNTENKLPQC